MNRSPIRHACILVLAFASASLFACNVYPGSTWKYSGRYMTCTDLIGGPDFLPLYTWDVTHPVDVLNGEGKYQLKIKTMKDYKPDLPVDVVLRYQQFRDDGGGFAPVGPPYDMELGCKSGNCKSKGSFTGFDALEGDRIEVSWQIGDNTFGSPAFVMQNTRVDFKFQVKFD